MTKFILASKNAQFSILATVGIVAISAYFWSFTLDDSFVTYRYAENLVHSGQLTWNVGEDPVEGATSFLWVMVSAVSVLLSIPPADFTQIVSVLAIFSVVAWLHWRSRTFHSFARLVLATGVGLSVPFVVHGSQGMETTFTAVILFFASLKLVRAIEAPSATNMLVWFALMFIAVLGRPELVIFAVAASAVALVLYAIERNSRALLSFVGVGCIFVFFGLIFVYWRYNYFGHLLPNPAYIKNTGQLSFESINQILEFSVLVLAPYAFVFIWSMLCGVRFWRDLAGIVPVLFAAALCLGYYATILPVQGYLYRFPIVLYPLIFLFVWYCERQAIAKGEGGGAHATANSATWEPKLAIVFFVGWPLILFPSAYGEIHARSQVDRVLVGQALKGIDGTMFVSEAGALPYYSNWRAYDWLGLTSEYIAHNGVTREYLDSIAPDFVMHRTPLSSRNRTKLITYEYLRTNQFAAVAAVVKTNYEDAGHKMHHLYFVRMTSPLCRQIVGRLLNVQGITFANLAEISQAEGFPVVLEGDEWHHTDSAGACTKPDAGVAN